MGRWLALLVIGLLVYGGLSGCVLVVADDDVAHDIALEHGSSKLARSIQRDVDREDSLRYSDIRVRENNGVVTLHGEADSLASMEQAIEIAARHENVATVVSHLSVEIDL